MPRGPALPELELDLPVAAPRPIAPKKKAEELKPLELAVDLTEKHHSSPPAAGSRFSAPAPPFGSPSQAPGGVAPMLNVRGQTQGMAIRGGVSFEGEEFLSEAHTLADYGAPPKHWFMAPLYAYRVFTRQQELKRALVGRREEAAQAATTAEDALIACAERVRPRAAGVPQYKRSIDELALAEELLRSRDGALAKEQDAHAERLASIDARISKLEAEHAAAQGEERRIAGELAGAEAALQRAEAKLKRAEIELRNVSASAAGQGDARR